MLALLKQGTRQLRDAEQLGMAIMRCERAIERRRCTRLRLDPLAETGTRDRASAQRVRQRKVEAVAAAIVSRNASTPARASA